MSAVTVWDDSGRGEPVVLVHGSGTWGDAPLGFETQRELADRYRLVVPDRRGYGRSPDVERSDCLRDADDVVELLDDGAHLLGHSSGGVVAMIAAARVPQSVRSLTLIEPACFQVAADDPVVAAALERNREALQAVPPELSDEDLVRLSYESVGFEPPKEPTPELVRASRTALTELPAWQLQVDTAVLAATDWPKLVLTGTWEGAPENYREYGGKPIMTCAAVTADRIGANLVRVPGASHWPHQQRPDVVHPLLCDLWASFLRGE